MRQTASVHPFPFTLFPAARRFAMMLLCVVALPACKDNVLNITNAYTTESNTTSGSRGPFVDTANLRMTVTSFYAFPGRDGILIEFDRADTLEPLRIGAGDILSVSLNGALYPVEEVRNISCSGEFGPCWALYYYRVSFSEDPQNLDLALDLQRQTGTSSVTTVTFPPRPTITQPAAGVTIDLSAALTVAWQADTAENDLTLKLSGQCSVYDMVYIIDKRETYTFPAGSFQFSQGSQFCIDATELPLSINTFRSRTYAADPALSPDSSIYLSLEHEITVKMVP